MMHVVSAGAAPIDDSRGEPFGSLPLELVQAGGIGTWSPRLGMMSLAATLLLMPFGLLAAFAAEPTPTRIDPLALASLGCGIAISALLLGLPLLGLAARLGARRRVRIDRDQVRILDHGLLRSRAWTEPLDRYLGIAHVVRSTLSGAHHELVLAHGDARRTVVLHRAERIGDETIAQATRLLGVPRIGAGELFRLGLGPRSGAAAARR